MASFYVSSASFDYLEVTSSFSVAPSVNINLGSNTSIFSGSFSGSFSGNGSQLSNVVVPMFKTTIDSPIITGTVANTLVTQSLIPANTFAPGNILEVKTRFIKTGVAATLTHRIYINSANSLSGAVLVGTYTSAAANLYTQMSRILVIRSNSVTEAINTGNSVTSDIGGSTSAPTVASVNWANAQYIIFAVVPGNAGDSVKCSFYKIFEL